jgi:hypothetical protein
MRKGGSRLKLALFAPRAPHHLSQRGNGRAALSRMMTSMDVAATSYATS